MSSTSKQNRRGSGSGRRQNAWEGGFGKIVIAAVALIALSALLWFITPWSRSGHTHMRLDEGIPVVEVSEPDEEGYVTTSDGRRIRVNVGLPERLVTIERDGEEIARFVTEVTNSPQAQQIGLMGRDELPPDRAMLFTWTPPTIVAMWMKDTLIPLDFLYVRPGGLIVGIEHNVPPCPKETVHCPGYSAPEPVQYVLEIAGGLAEELGLELGDRLVLGDMLP